MPKPEIKATGGNWSPQDWPIYFVASSPEYMERAKDDNNHMLFAVNEMKTDAGADLVEGYMDAGTRVLIDSGVFWLSTQHAKANDLSMDEALSLAPDRVDNFDWLFERYVELMRRFGDKSWGYIEIDQGGRENKIKTRRRLEGLGLRPIPVYHPFNDGWDYFDYLAERYDRICFGNVVQADAATRKRLLATAWERRRKYPHLWIHLLGLTPGAAFTSLPLTSCDSSTWISGPRWGVHPVYAANAVFDRNCAGFCAPLIADDDREGGGDPLYAKMVRLCAVEAHCKTETARTVRLEMERALGIDMQGKDAPWKHPTKTKNP